MVMASQAQARKPATSNVFDQLLLLSHRALEALEGGDLDRLGEIMARREEIIDEGSDTSGTNAERLASALRLREADTRLQLALASRRSEIGHDMETMDSGEAVRSAYGSRSRGKGQINVVR